MERVLRIFYRGDAADLKRASDEAYQALGKVEGAQDQTGISAEELGRKVGALAVAYLSLNSAMALAQKGYQSLASKQAGQLTFEVLFQDAERARRKIEELYAFSAKTPFEFEPIKQAALALETFGLNSSRYLKDAGDLAAAFGKDISEVAGALGRLNSGDFGEAFERLRDFGISRKMLEGEGLVFDKSGSYQGSVEQALDAVQRIIQARFGGMMERQSQIANGQMSTLADNFQTKLNTVMTPSFETLNEEVAKLNAGLDGAFGDEMQQNAKVLGDVVNGVAVAAIALTKAISETFDELLAPLRWLRETAQFLGQIGGEREVARAKVLSDSRINPNRREHYADLVGKGTDLTNIARDFRVRSWGNDPTIQQDLGIIATIMADAKQIVNGTKQYRNFEPYGPLPAPGGSTTPANKPGDKTNKGGKAIAEIQESWVDSMVLDSVDALSRRLDEIRKTGSSGLGLASTSLSGLQRPRLTSGIPSSLGSEALPSFIGLADTGARSRKDEPTSYLSDEDLGLVSTEAEKALRSGLEAGVATFLDGGIAGFGDTLYSVSKDRLTTALTDAVMSSELKDAFGGLGSLIANPFLAGFGALFAVGLGKAIEEELGRHDFIKSMTEKHVDPQKTERDREIHRLRIERDRLGNELISDTMAMGGNPMKEDKTSFNPFDAVMSLFVPSKEAEYQATVKAIEALEAKTKAEGQTRDAAESAAMALREVADRGSRVSNSVSSTDLLMKLSGVSSDDPRYNLGLIGAYRGGLNSAGFSDDMAARLVGDREYQTSIVNQYRAWSADGFSSESSNDDYLINLFGGRFQGDALKQMLEGTLLPMFSRLADLNQPTQSVGSLSDPETALRFDAPETRQIINNNQFIVQTQAFMGDRADAREFAILMASEIQAVEGLAV